jgi:magnesium-protoporphyrin IX monomethyl ester (oxidative) cyclase
MDDIFDTAHPIDPNAAARADSLVAPRFYTTDFAAMDRINVEPIRTEWNALMEEYRTDANKGHFERAGDFREAVAALPDDLRVEFLDFLISSITSEYSGCVLYNEIAKSVTNPDIKELMRFMARDEARHASFINHSLKDFNLGVDLSRLKREKKYTYFAPKFIFYATYLSEKIGYARYISIYRRLEQNPELRFHPIFLWFERWCNDEFRHGESFALLLRAMPELLRGRNRLWIRFFLLAVYATMHVRDRRRPVLHHALGLAPIDYDYQVFSITSAISRQVFPFTLDTDHPEFRRMLGRLADVMDQMEVDKKRGGISGWFGRITGGLEAGWLFARLYLRPVVPNELPADVRLAPSW